jgi:NTP pyrophosphatase (non-canonical NTP hydrolase)
MDQSLLDKFYNRVWFKKDSLYWQTLMVFEETAELQKELTKTIRGKGNRDDLIAEIADVEITIESIKFGLDIRQEDIEKIKEYKINRFFERHNQ